VQFLRNHDELDLGRLTKRQRQAVFDAFGPEPSMQLYKRGIRRRLAPMMQGDRRRLELAYSLMMALPGTPVFRYGDEIGMGDNLDLPERNCARTPMQWSDEPQAEFTKSDKPVIPLVSEGPYGYQHVNVAAQKRDPKSLMDWTERMIRMRKEVPEIGWGDFAILDTGISEVLAMRYDWRSNSVLSAVQHLCFIVAAPALFLPLGIVLINSRILPRLFGYLAVALATVFAAIGIIFLLTLALPPAVTALGGVQALWWLSAAQSVDHRVDSLYISAPCKAGGSSYDGLPDKPESTRLRAASLGV